MAAFTYDETLVLIRSVEQKGVIWNPFNEFFRLPDKKVEAWQQISNELESKYTVDELKKKWTGLRSYFNRSVAEGGWPYWNAMRFLRCVNENASVSQRAHCKSLLLLEHF